MRSGLVLSLVLVSSVIGSASTTNSSCDYSDQFHCDNGICKHVSFKCDGFDDCGDSSDEEGCDRHLRAAWYAGGGLGFVIVGTVVVGVAYWYMSQKRRLLSHTQAVATTPPTARPATATAQTTFTAAPPTLPVEQHYPVEFKAGPQEAPPPYPAHGYPTYSPVPQSYPQQVQAPCEAPPSYPGCTTSIVFPDSSSHSEPSSN